jgi:hypothetical protein
MKATIDIPDELYRQVKAKSALEGRAIREVATELFELYVHGGAESRSDRGAEPRPARDRPPAWFGVAGRYGAKAQRHDPAAVRVSVERGWAEEVAEREAGLDEPDRR